MLALVAIVTLALTPSAGGQQPTPDTTPHASRRDDRVSQATAREPEAGRHVLEFEIRQFRDDGLRCQTRCQQVEDVRDPDAKATNAGTAAALSRINGDAIGKRGHGVHSDYHWTGGTNAVGCLTRRWLLKGYESSRWTAVSSRANVAHTSPSVIRTSLGQCAPMRMRAQAPAITSSQATSETARPASRWRVRHA